MGVDLVTFRETRAIPNLLRSHPGNDAITTNVSHENTGGPHVATAGQVTDGIDEADELTGYQLVEKAVEYSADDAVDMGDGEGPDRSREAIVIQRAVRRYLLKFSEGSSKDEMKTRRDRLFKLCSASANAVHARYRKIYLGPVPHLLLCLDWIILSAQAEKVTIKARRKDATLPSQALSDLSTLQTQITHILKEAHGLRKVLEPGSTLHIRVDLRDEWDAVRDLEPLRDVVEKARNLVERLSDPRFPAVEFECAWNGIMPSRVRK